MHGLDLHSAVEEEDRGGQHDGAQMREVGEEGHLGEHYRFTENKLSAILSGISHSAIKSTSAAPDRIAPAAKKRPTAKSPSVSYLVSFGRETVANFLIVIVGARQISKRGESVV